MAPRRRIATTLPASPRLPWTIGGTLIGALSTALWLNLFEVSSALARHLAKMF